jgi:hypothetical protein
LTLVAPPTLRAKVVYKAVQRGCASSIGVTIVNAGAVYLIDLLPFLHLSSLLVRPPRLGLLTAPVAGLEERL